VSNFAQTRLNRRGKIKMTQYGHDDVIREFVKKDQRTREADGYRLKRINEAEGDVARFSALLAEYVKAPVVTRRRIYIETLQDVMPGIRSKIIVDEQTRSILPLLNLDPQKGERP
jgi:membrane protease subunit HflK